MSWIDRPRPMDRPPTAGRRVGRRRAVAALLLAGVLLLVQVVLAAHQVEHLTGPESGHDCPLCLTGQGLDQASWLATVSLLLTPRGHHSPVSALPSLHLRPIAPYRVRAPPAAPVIA